jgi:hypothetical protein
MNGYLIVASYRYAYYRAAVLCAETLKDYNPDAHVTLFTHEQWVDDRAVVFDNVVTGIPASKRSKMWAMARTPYEKTLYIDADAQVQHEDIGIVHDLLGDNDLMMTEIRKYSARCHTFPGGEFRWHCGVCLYNNKPDTLQFMQDWFDYYQRQQEEWDVDPKLYPPEMKVWDTWTFWRLMHLEGYDQKLKIEKFPQDARWNFHNFKYDEAAFEDIIIYHNTIRENRRSEKDITE